MTHGASGRTTWAIPGGHIPLASTGHEPTFVSCDKLCVLNTSATDAQLALTIYYSDRDAVGPYPLSVAARRVRHLRLNDLIEPEAMPLEVPYACVVLSSVPVVVQFSRRDSGQAATAITGGIAFPAAE